MVDQEDARQTPKIIYSLSTRYEMSATELLRTMYDRTVWKAVIPTHGTDMMTLDRLGSKRYLYLYLNTELFSICN